MAICPEKEKLFLIFEFMSMDLKQYLDITKSQYLYTVYYIPNSIGPILHVYNCMLQPGLTNGGF